ncbi:MAG: hypothetical protein M0024_01405 [Nitrospiraceae bacterium]|nr:hypothetical protein [Nitrospiraceae bacterium]
MTRKGLMTLLLTTLFVIAAFATSFAADGPPATPNDALQLSGINLQGDTAYLVRGKALAVGVGSDVATMYDGLLTVRVEAIAPQQTQQNDGVLFVGMGPMINIPKLVTRLGGQWTAGVINPSFGVMPLYDFRAGKIDAGLVVSIIRVTF